MGQIPSVQRKTAFARLASLHEADAGGPHGAIWPVSQDARNGRYLRIAAVRCVVFGVAEIARGANIQGSGLQLRWR